MENKISTSPSKQIYKHDIPEKKLTQRRQKQSASNYITDLRTSIDECRISSTALGYNKHNNPVSQSIKIYFIAFLSPKTKQLLLTDTMAIKVLQL